MTIWTIQSNLNRGELDPKLVGRIDLQAYYNGLKYAQNLLPIPQGGVKKRPGMAYLGTALGDGRLENFSFNTEQNYLLVFTDTKMQVYKDGVLQTNLNGSGNDYINTPWPLAEIRDFDYIQTADTVIITHPDYAPRSIVRTSDTNWSLSTITLTNIPQYDFNDGLSPTPVDEVQDIKFTNVNEGDRYKLSVGGVLTEEIVYATPGAAGAVTNEERMVDAMLALINTGNTGIAVAQQSTGPDVFRITLSGESANDWELISGTPIFTKNASFEVLTTAVSDGTSRKEDVWSATRGWPVCVTFHEGRLWFGGSRSRPQTIWGSMVNDFYNFKEGRARDDELVSATLDTDQVNAIRSIFSNRTLQIFTSGGEFYVPESPITPENIAVTPQTKLGSKRIRPISIDGVTMFVQRTGKALNQFQFINEYQANQVRNVSVLAPHLIRDPIEIVASRGTEDTDANYVYIVNSLGFVTVFNTLASEDVEGFTEWQTNGAIKSCAVVDDRLYFLVSRSGNTTQYFVEREDDELNTDAAVKEYVASDTITGLGHLEDEIVSIKADGAVKPNQVVTGGQITIDRVAETIEVGKYYAMFLETMPLNIPLQNGPIVDKKKRIVRAALELYESNGVIVNGQRIADKTIGQDQFSAPEPYSGIQRIFIPGWDLSAQIRIYQSTPMPLTILSIGMELEVPV